MHLELLALSLSIRFAKAFLYRYMCMHVFANMHTQTWAKWSDDDAMRFFCDTYEAELRKVIDFMSGRQDEIIEGRRESDGSSYCALG